MKKIERLRFIYVLLFLISCNEKSKENDEQTTNTLVIQENHHYKFYKPYFIFNLQNETDISQYFSDQINGLAKTEIKINMSNANLEESFFNGLDQRIKITYLELRNIKNNKILTQLSSFKNLKYLIITNVEIKNQNELFLEISKLKYLQSLDLIDCRTSKKLSPQICELGNLKSLSIESNNISEIPDEIGRLHNLEILYIHGNIENLPDSIQNLKKLRELNLGYNSLSNFPNVVLNLPNLVYLNLESNNFRDIPQEIKRLKKLKVVSIANTGISRCIFDATLLKENIKEIEHNTEIKISFKPYESEYTP